ncbi:MAG TPA: cytochrome c oxidase subunit II [Nocardioides sp.]|uniref:cytochrome c oxidase subunit II n=1 Tax=Nocardioides sp. TaxID=35761 RepID=UPI002F3F1BDC
MCAGRTQYVVTAGALLLSASVLTACAGHPPSTLEPDGPKASEVATSWWLLFAVAAAVCVIVIALAIIPLVIRRRARADPDNQGLRFVGIFGVAIPAVILGGVFALGLRDLSNASSPPSPTQVTIDVVAHQWWWEFRYSGPGTGTGSEVVTANEVHVPVGVPVELRLSTADVIHSFWLPQLTPKTDLIPKKVNTTWLTVSKPGVYRGECAEYCGVEHAYMDFELVAQSTTDFRAWVAKQGQPAAQPTSALARQGMSLVTTTTCASCHTVRGTAADGTVGPDLTHVGSRPRIGGQIISNTPDHLASWIDNPQNIKPGVKMPPQPLSQSETQAVVAYLEGLK